MERVNSGTHGARHVAAPDRLPRHVCHFVPVVPSDTRSADLP